MNVIRQLGDPILRSATAPVTAFDDDLRRLVDRMFAAMYEAQGVGLAANQIGVALRLFVMDCEGVKLAVINPHVRDLSPDTIDDQLEGCLSVPGRHYPTPRATSATIIGQDERGHPVDRRGEGMVARCFQHEVDHLDGKLYLDRLTGRIRKQALRELREQPYRPAVPSKAPRRNILDGLPRPTAR